MLSCDSRQTRLRLGTQAPLQIYRRQMSSTSVAGLKNILRVSEEVADAVATDKPVVALESTIYTHGAIGSDLGLEAIIRAGGGVPAVVGILDGIPTVGLTPDEVARMVEDGGAKKVSRRDVAYLAGMVRFSLISTSANCIWP
jgi:pseudouridylate synthase / pseudouridine kinase